LQQLGLEFRSKSARGGARDGAGRKRLPARARHTPGGAPSASPVHVTLRAFTHSLRHQYVAGVVLRALHQSNSSCFRVVHHSVQANHLHLLVEAENKHALSSGMRGLVIRIARRVNQLLFRRGRFWADRWHSTTLTSPRQVRNALVYVLKNRHKHAASTPNKLDPLSSIQWFDGLAVGVPPSFHSVGPPCAPATTWLLRIGWRRLGLIKPNEAPKSNH
jgi:REP element-mobilizing transposase RayT